jgi:hypothetical protein
MVSLVEYLGIPGTIGAAIIVLYLIMQLIGEFVELCGKVVPEFFKVRKYFKRKKDEKIKEKKLLERLAEKLESFEGHYNPDNIAKRNEWMRGVDDRAVNCGIQMENITTALTNVTQALDKNTKMTEDMFVENSRDRIINFAEKAADYDILLSREQFRRIDRIYQDYEVFLAERNRQNGEVDIAYESIQDGYRYRLQHHTFLEDIKGYRLTKQSD